MHRNPRLSAKMHPLRENTMRLGDAMKYGKILLDLGIPIQLWDGSGWEVYIKPDDSFSTSSGRAKEGGRRYLARGAGLVKTWPITLLTDAIKPGAFIGVPAIKHFLAHRRATVGANPGTCVNPLCKSTRTNPGESSGSRFHEITAADVHKYMISAFGRKWTTSFMGGIRRGDIGKRIFLRGGVLQVENDEQRARRLGTSRNPRSKYLRPRSAKVYCAMCGEWNAAKGPYKVVQGAGWMTGKLACLDCRKGLAGLKRARYDFKRKRMPGERGTRRNQGDAGENPRIAHEEIVGAFLAGRSKKIGPRYWTDGQLLRVWGNLVAKKTDYGVDIMDAGWRTLLTRNVLNTVLRHMGAGTIYQKKRQWYISTPQGDVAWPGEWPVKRGGAAANRGRRVRSNGRGENLTVSDISQWIDNDEGLYNWWRGSRQSKTAFIRENRAELEASIKRVLNRPPAEKTWRDYARNPRIRAWNIVAITPGRGREVMQSGHKDRAKAEDIAKVYRRIAKKEGRLHTRYVVEPFRYSDWQTRVKKNPLTQKEVDQLRRNETFYRMGQRIEVRAGNTKDAMQLQGAMQESRVIRQQHRAKGVQFRPGPQGLTLRQIDALPNPGSNAWNVYLGGKLIDTVFYSASAKVTADEVKRSLVNHDGYDPGITVRRSYRFGGKKKNPLTRRETADMLREARYQVREAGRSARRVDRIWRAGRGFELRRAAIKYGGASPVASRRISARAQRLAHYPDAVLSNPHAGLRGLMSKGAARNASRFGRI